MSDRTNGPRTGVVDAQTEALFQMAQQVIQVILAVSADLKAQGMEEQQIFESIGITKVEFHRLCANIADLSSKDLAMLIALARVAGGDIVLGYHPKSTSSKEVQ